ncbi:MAG TPA: tandem-95 repeat protein [Flavobacteriaceae bacterium]|nr:tandem-95 repeat protein [Flavobacteriaceae bacterium]
MQNFTFVSWNMKYIKRGLLGAFLLIGFLAQSQIGVQSPSIRNGVTFQWEDSQTINGTFNNNNPATIKSITIDGSVFNTFVVPSGYELTRLGTAGNGTNNIWLNGSQTVGTSSTSNAGPNSPWNSNARAAFQSRNLNHYFEASAPQGDDICLNFNKANGINGAQETDSQLQTLFYDPPIPSNAGGILAVTERGGNNCLYVRFFGIPAGGGPEQPLGDTFIRTSGNLTGGGFSEPANGSDYWGSGREQDNGQTISIGLFQLDNVAPVGSKITRVRFLGASNDHGDGKFFILQRYAQPQTKMGCVDEPINGQIDNSTTVPTGSTYTLMSGPSPSGVSFTLNTDGSYEYVPQPGFTGDVTFTYKVRLPAPNQNITDTNTVTLTINPNPDEATVQFTCGSNPNNGVLSVLGPLGSQYRYALDSGNFQSSTQFNNIGVGTYTVKVKNKNTECISEVVYEVEDADNAAPVAFGEDFSTGLNQSITFNVLDDNGDGLDFDPDGDPFSIISNTNPQNGSFVNNGNGSFTFTPNNGFTGSTFFTYTIQDDPTPCTNLPKTATATVTINVVSDPDPRDCNCTPLYKNSNFVSPKLIAGQDLKIGAVYRFSDVFPSNPHGTTLDALVKIEEFAGGASLKEIDVTSSGLPEAFQPRIESTNNNDQSVLFSITFVEDGGNYGDEVEISFYGTPLDIDGDNVSTREYAEVSLPDAYFVSNNTFLNITQTATEIRGESTSISVAPGDDVSLDPRYTYSNYWQTKSSLTYRIGKLDGDSDRYYSFNVSCADFDDPDAVFITNPVICGNVSDEQGNPLANVSIDVVGSDGSSETVMTDGDGNYKKEVVIPDPFSEVVFEIMENDLPGYISISDVDGANDNLITRTISLESSCGNDFVDGFEVILELVSKTNILCNGDNTGAITVTTSGGVPPYSYTLNGGTPQGSPTFNNLTAGNYNIVVTDSLGNTDDLLVTLTQPEPIIIELTKTNAAATALCQNGTATATVSGGVGPYTYQWDDPNNQTTATATGLSASLLGGTQYTVVVTDANGCTEEQSVIITCVQNCDAVINVTNITDVLCKGQNTGSASVQASSTANPGATFTYTWNTTPQQVDAGLPAGTPSTISEQFAGVYTVSVTIDGTLCQPVEESITISEPSTAVSATATATDETGPTTNDGTATANASGGIPPYTYLWSPGGQTTQTITGLSDGTYTVTVTDANGCKDTTTVTVNNGDCRNLSATALSTPVSCNGGNDGTATVNVSGGLGNYTYSWSPGGQTTQSITGLTAGTYTVTVTDTATLCTVNSSTTVGEPTKLTSGIAVTNVACFGESTGSLDLTVGGGTTPYSYVWSNGETTQDISNLSAGTYSVIITDANGCILNDEATVGQPSEALDITITAQDDIVCGNGTGSVTVRATGGTPPYSYSLDGGTPQASETFDNLAAGTYTITAIDGNLCNDTVEVTILENCTIAVNDFRDTVVNVPINGNVLTNDEDLEGDNQVVTTLTVTSDQGVVVNIAADGSFTYNPPADYTGGDFFMYSIEDDGNPQATDSATVFIRINPIGQNNTIANADAVFTEVGVAIPGNVLTNDVDLEGDNQTVTNPGTYTLPGGELVLNADGTFVYTPNPGFTGTDTFTYDIIDDNVLPATDSAVLTITVVGDPAMNYTFAVDDGYGGNQGATITGNVLDNDFDPEGDDQTVDVAISPSGGPANGSVTLNADGSFSYTPNDPTFFGNDSFVYSIFDNGSPVATDSATVSIIIAGENTTIAVNDFRDTVVNVPINGNVLTNDEDLEGDNQVVTTLTVTSDQGVVVNIAADGSFTYNPPADYTGGDFFMYSIEDDGNPQATDSATVFIRINPIGQNNTIANADAVFTEVGVAIPGNVLTNDVDLEGDNQTVTNPGTYTLPGGELVLNADGTFVYTPNPGFTGTDTFTYDIIDDNVLPATDSAVLTITVVGDPAMNYTFAVDDGYGGNQGATITGNVLDNDFDPEGDDQTVDVAISPSGGPANGSVTLNADGSFSYTPNDPTFFGNDSFVYSIFDNGSPVATDSATVSIIIAGENTTIAVNDFRDTVVNVPINGNVLTNDEDLEGDNQVVTTLTVTSDQGVVVNIAADGSFTYNPPADYTGGDFFMYSIEDDGNPQATDSATVFIRINPIGQNNTIANADAVFTEVGVAIPGNVLTNDVDLEGDNQTVTNPGTYTLPGGELVLNADGTFVYTPNPGFTGTDTFTYDIIDDNVLPATDSAVLTITVVGDPAMNYTFAVDDGYGGNQGATITGNVLDNDFDPEGDDQTVDVAISPSGGPANGSVTLNADGSFSYTPNDPTFFGNDSFVYSIFDNGSPVATDSATVSIIIAGENLILAVDDINNTYVGLPVNGSVATNDENYDGPVGTETFTLVSGPTAGGTLTFNPDGTYSYTPPADPNVKEDTFVYQICDAGNPVACDTATVYIEILPIPNTGNEPPVANADTNTTEVNTPVSGFVLPNDFDPDGDPISVTAKTDPTNGSVSINPDGSYTYAPNTDFIGEDTFTYTICDNQTPALCDTTTVTIQVIADNGNITVANDDAYNGLINTVISGNVLDNDNDPEGDNQTVDVAVTPINGPANGTLSINPDGSFTYTPDPGFVGTDSFIYEIFDDGAIIARDQATVYLTVGDGVNEILAIDDINDTFVNLPVSGSVATNDINTDGPAGTEVFTLVTGPTNGALTFNPDGTYTYEPATDFVGEDTFEYQVCDGGNPIACDTATVYIEVQPLGSPDNEPPVANADTNSTQVGIPVDGNVLPNDFDPDGDMITVTANTPPSNGSVSINPDGTYTYTPDPGFEGEDTFTYTICDDGTPSLCDTATVTIQVLGSPDNITTAVDDAYYGFPDADITGNVLDNDTDPEGDDQTVDVAVSPSNGPTNGTVALNADGSFTYTPNAGFVGTDSFVYEIFDDNADVARDVATVYISIADPGNEILAVDDINDTFVNLPVSGSVATNDENFDGPAGTEVFTLISGPTAGGTLTFNPDGTYDYTPAADYVGDDTFVYQICDGGNPIACDTANVTITIVDDPIIGNDPPVAINDVNITEINVPVDGNVLVNDFDPDAGDVIMVTSNTPPSSGNVVLNPDGSYTFTPATDFTGVVTFEYTICDNAATPLCDSAIVTIYVIADPGNITVANDDAYYGEVNMDVTGNVLDNDSDPEGNDQTLNVGVTPVEGPFNGSVVVNADGTFVYTPGADFKGNDRFVYEIFDNGSPIATDQATVYILIEETPAPAIAIVKSGMFIDGNQDMCADVDEVIRYTFTVTNEGNVPLENIVVTDPLLEAPNPVVAITFVDGDTNGDNILDLDETWTYTADYAITQDDIDAGEVTNQATVEGTDEDGTTVNDLSGDTVTTDTITITTLCQNPVIAIVKEASYDDGGDCSQPGELIDYTFTVTNQGNVSLSNISVTDPLLEAPNPVVAIVFTGGDTDGDSELDVTETWTYTASYAITQDDIDAGEVDNQARAEGTAPDGTVVDDLSGDTISTDTITTTTLCQSPAIAIVKDASYDDGGDCSQPGEMIDYTFIVTNEGNVTLSNIVVTDLLLGGNVPGPVNGDTNGDGNLDTDETWFYNGTYLITQDDIDAGEVNNQATAEGTAPNGTVVDDLSGDTISTDTITTTTLCQSPVIAIVKEASYDDGGDCSQPGELIDYTFTVTNQGNVSLSNIAVTDPLLEAPNPVVAIVFTGGDTDGDSELDVTETWTYTASYAITQDDIDAGEVDNQATAEGTAPDGTVVDDLSGDTISTDTITTTTLCQSPVIAIVKEASYDDGGDCSQPGELIDYTFTVTNQGNVSLSNITVTDPLLEAPNPVVPIVFGGGDTDGDNELDVDETWTYTASYTITQDDIDAGEVDNQATAEGTAPDGTIVDDLSGDTISTDTITTTTLCQSPVIAIVKEASYDDGGDCSQPGELIDYTFTVTNQGNVSLSNITVTDPLLEAPNPVVPIVFGGGDTDGDNELDVDETWTYTASYTITQVDIDAGEVNNQATAEGTAPDGTVVDDLSGDTISTDTITTTTLCNEPSIALIKRGTLNDENGNGCTDVDETISYSFEVKNTGNVTLTAVTINDDLVNVIGGPITLAPDETDTTTFTAVYSITQADIDAGEVVNQAVAMGTAPDGTVVEDDSDFDLFTDDRPTVTGLCQNASIALIKEGTVMDENGSGCADPKETIEYRFTVQNTGNVTLTNIDIEDPLVNVLGGPITLAPGQTDVSSFSATYLITQADINAGEVINQATVEGTDPNGDVVNDDSDFDVFTDDRPTITALCQGPSIALIKTGEPQDQNGNGCVDLGESILYEFVVKNTGNVVLTNITITDPLVAVTGGPITLNPNDSDSNTFRAEYFVTQEDVDAGFVINQALAEGTAPDGTIVSDLSDNDSFDGMDPTELGLCQDPRVSLEKSGVFNDDNGDGIPQPGETISYVFSVENTGNVRLFNLVLTDDLEGIVVEGGPIPVLEVDEIDDTTFTATYTISQEDIDNGEVVNQAVITGETSNGTEVEDTSDDPNDLTNTDLDGDGDPDDPTVTILPNVQSPPPPFEIFNGITPDGDGLNDFFRVLGIENFPDNNMKIYNRWGVLVFETDGYGGANGEENVFRGFSNGRATVRSDETLPTGTYFYILVREDPNSGETLKNSGYLYINR